MEPIISPYFSNMNLINYFCVDPNDERLPTTLTTGAAIRTLEYNPKLFSIKRENKECPRCKEVSSLQYFTLASVTTNFKIIKCLCCSEQDEQDELDLSEEDDNDFHPFGEDDDGDDDFSFEN